MIRKLLAGKAESTLAQALRYAVLGGFCTVLDLFLTYALTQWAGINYLISAGAGFAAGLTVNYFISAAWVFTESAKSKKVEIAAFIAIGAAGLGLNELFVWLFASLMGMHYMIAKCIATALVFAWNFLARKWFLYR